MLDEQRLHFKRLVDAETQRLQDENKAMNAARTQTNLQQLAFRKDNENALREQEKERDRRDLAKVNASTLRPTI